MLQNLDFISENELAEWVESHLQTDECALSTGYQGRTLLYQESTSEDAHKLVIKVALGNFLSRPVNLSLLRHEYRVYQKLQGMDTVPVCYGMVKEKYLVIEFIEGMTIRQNRPEKNSEFYVKLLGAIKEMHRRGVAHNDLKRKENLLVTHDEQPVMIDFGVSIIKKNRLRWLNGYLFNLVAQFDYNAWCRHKYDKQIHELSDEDKKYYNKTFIEIYSRKIKRFYKDRVLGLF
ncbi:hypothetical protein MNBD_GAMMA10-3173 [hydrothermal vent metagenome]|uniref:Protein kinase domain-containing protein n=1 Tax=hydrothermal vent metagenome TaxID=652676 RepID=A0A3B0XC53_9ZZZZ